MSTNTAILEHDIAPQSTDMEIELNAANTTEEQTVKEDSELENEAPTPSGGPKAWSYVLATFLMFISAWGLTQVFGIFQEIYIATLLPGVSPSAISWIGSVQCFLVIVLGALTGPLFDASYLRPLLVLGCTLIVLGMATLSLATAYRQVFLSQSLCVRLGAGLIYVPSLALVTTLIGGIIFTFMLRRLVPAIGFPWAVRAVALVNLLLSIIALAIILPHHPQPTGHRRAVLDLRAFRELSFMLFALALLVNYVAFYIPAFYLPVIATKALGQSQDFAFESLAFVSVGSFFGRTIPMLAASRVGSVQVYLVATLAAVVVLFSWTAIHNVAGFVVFSVVFGLISGALVAAPSAAISHPVLAPSMSVIGTRLGILWMFGSVGVLIGAPIYWGNSGCSTRIFRARAVLCRSNGRGRIAMLNNASH
ncbi:MAG: hypothetical protein ASARMPREDX12_007756 [Alectoria sarmentosa]|nr:MAG: hypothetical protein ASARMPREDX12_007756 [Alectoria sarmentosa]